MSSGRRKALLIIAAVVVIVGAVAWKLLRTKPPTVRELANATITAIDVAGQTAEIEFIHPKTGRTMRIVGALAPDHQIFIDDQPARFSDLRVGDSGSVKGLIHTSFTGYAVEAQLVRITRPPAASASAPAATRP